MSTAAPQPAPIPARPQRRGVVTVLLILAAVVTFLFAFASWANRQALDTNEWTKTSSELLENEEIRDALATYLVDQLYANVDVKAELEGALPPRAQPLAGPAAGGLREFALRAAERALEGPRMQAAWENLNRNAHEQFVAVVKDEQTERGVSTAGGEVTLDLAPLVQQVASTVGVGERLAGKLPPDAGQLTVLRSDQLSTAQDVADGIETLAIVLLILGLALYALAVYLAKGRRRETLRAVGLIFAGVGAVVLVVRGLAGDVVVGELASTAAIEPAVSASWTISTSLLADIAGNLIVNGIILVVVAWVAGPTGVAVGLRRATAPFMRERPGLVYAAVGLIFLLMIAWGPTRAFRLPLSLLLIAVLLVVAVEALRRQTAAEFPDATLGGEGLRGSWDRMRGSVSQRVSGVRGGGAATGAVEERLERLASLRERGVLTEEEFQAQKTQLLSSS